MARRVLCFSRLKREVDPRSILSERIQLTEI